MPGAGWARWLAVLASVGVVVSTLAFVLGMGALILDALLATQGPGEVPKAVGVVVLSPAVAMAAALLGGLVGSGVAPFRLTPDDPVRRRAFLASAALVVSIVGVTVWAFRGLL